MDYWIGVFTLTCIYLIAILGVSVLYGFTGLFTMGHAGFMSLGAYTSAIITIYFGVPNFVGIVAGGLVAALIGVLIGILTLRMSGDYFVIVTLGIGEAIRIIIQNLTGITGGARGLQGIPSGSQAWMVAVVLVTVVVFLANFKRSKLGRNCIAIREEPLAAAACGIDVFRHKLLAMAISCALCGLSGALLAHYMHYLVPTMFNMAKSNELIMTAILGGRGSITGTLIAGAVLIPLPEFLRFGSAQEWRMVLYGLLVVITIIFRPTGLVGGKELTPKAIRQFGMQMRQRLHRMNGVVRKGDGEHE